jgi:hypothetical protein
VTIPFVEYPDPVVVRYMERVAALSPRARETLDEPIWNRLRDGVWIFSPGFLLLSPFVAFISWKVIRDSSQTVDPVARVAYRQFWKTLRRNGWTLVGRQRAAWGLIGVRRRVSFPAFAMQVYGGMAGVVPRQSIGWDESATA